MQRPLCVFGTNLNPCSFDACLRQASGRSARATPVRAARRRLVAVAAVLQDDAQSAPSTSAPSAPRIVYVRTKKTIADSAAASKLSLQAPSGAAGLVDRPMPQPGTAGGRARAGGRSAASAAVRQQRSAASQQDAETAARADADVLQSHIVQWYPGHIARAERQLREQLKMIDVVLEVRDARIPVSTCHPGVAGWVGAKPRLVVMNRRDQISKRDRAAWDAHLGAQGQRTFWTDGQEGRGVRQLRAAALELSRGINEKRAARGLQPRSVRACVIGFPNIGKSALINRLLERKVVAAAPKPGVTRVLRWVRVHEDLDLLDAPGIIPAAFDDQVAAQRLAMCNDIGEAAYVDSIIAAAMLARIKQLPQRAVPLAALRRRYGLDPLALSGESYVAAVAGELFGGDKEKAGVRLLNDYRGGALGAVALETPKDLAARAR